MDDIDPPSKRRRAQVNGSRGDRIIGTCEDSRHSDATRRGSSHDDSIHDYPLCISPLQNANICNRDDQDTMADDGDYSCDALLHHRGGVIKVKVHIDQECHLIPCPGTSTVQWLVEEVCNRYFIQHGRQPTLHLVKGGSLLSCSDAIADVLLDGEEVQAHIDHWTTTPIHQHYSNTCTKFNQSKPPIVR